VEKQNAQKLDKATFQKIFKEFYSPLVRTSFMLTRRKDVAEDMVQDLFVYLWEERPVFDLSNPFLYLRKATISRSINWLKKERRISLSEPPENPPKGDATDSVELEPGQLIVAIKDAIETLPPKCRLIFQLHRFEGLTMREIGEYLDISPNTVENQLTKALRLLRNKFQK